jgi:hypothetical protein
MVQVPMAVAGWDASEEDIDVCATYAEYILAEDWGLQGTFTACTFAADADMYKSLFFSGPTEHFTW